MKEQSPRAKSLTSSSNKKKPKQDFLATKLALDVCMAEYRRMVDEILAVLEWHRNLIQYALAIIAGAATVISLFPKLPEIYLVASVLLSIIAWIFAEQSIKLLTYNQYIMHILAPKVNGLINTIEPQENETAANLKDLISFDFFSRAGGFRSFVSGFFGGGKFLVALFPGLGFAIAYLYAVPQDFMNWSVQIRVFYLIVLIIAILPLVFGLLASPYYFLRYRPKMNKGLVNHSRTH